MSSAGNSRSWPTRLYEAALDLLLPPRCPACSAAVSRSGIFCEQCWPSVLEVAAACPRCGLPVAGPHGPCLGCVLSPPPFIRAAAPLLYGGQVATAIKRIKYGGLSYLCRPLGQILARSEEACQLLGSSDVVLPVPLHPARLRRRGFNQAALLAQEAMRASGCRTPLSFSALQRTRDTTSQAGLSRAGRRDNQRGAFAVARKGRVADRRVLLVDDVLTTGATAAACTEALHRAGAREVCVLTLARSMT